MLEVHLLTLPKNATASDALIDRLPQAQQVKARTLGEKRRLTFVWSRLFLLRLVSQFTGTPETNWVIIEQDGLPPKLCDLRHENGVRKQPAFSISHSDNLIAITLALIESQHTPLLGVDIERIKPTRRLETARYFCNLTQLETITKSPSERHQRQVLTALWTQKEAWFKARHTPIFNTLLKALTLIPNNEQADVFTASLQHDFVISICCDTATPPTTARYYCSADSAQQARLIHALETQSLAWQRFQSTLQS